MRRALRTSVHVARRWQKARRVVRRVVRVVELVRCVAPPFRCVSCLRAEDWTVPSWPGRVVSWRLSDRCPRGVTKATQKKHI